MSHEDELSTRERVVIDSMSVGDEDTYKLHRSIQHLFPDFELLVARRDFLNDRISVGAYRSDTEADLRAHGDADDALRSDCFQALTGHVELPNGDPRRWTEEQRQVWHAVQLLEAHHEVLPPRRLLRSDDGRTTWPEIGIRGPVVISRGILITDLGAIIGARDYLERRLATTILTRDEFLERYLPPGPTSFSEPNPGDQSP